MAPTIEDYRIKQLLEGDDCSQLYKAIDRNNNQQVVIRIISLHVFQSLPGSEQAVCNQFENLDRLARESPYFVRSLSLIKNSHQAFFVQEYCNDGSIEKLLRKQEYLSQKKGLGYINQLIQAISVLNESQGPAKNLNTSHILLHNDQIKINNIVWPTRISKKNLYSLSFIAPEVVRGDKYGANADLWSLGAIIYHMFYGRIPFEGQSVQQINQNIAQMRLSFHTSNRLSPLSQEIIKKCLVPQPSMRIDLEGIISGYEITKHGEIYRKQQPQSWNELRSSTGKKSIKRWMPIGTAVMNPARISDPYPTQFKVPGSPKTAINLLCNNLIPVSPVSTFRNNKSFDITNQIPNLNRIPSSNQRTSPNDKTPTKISPDYNQSKQTDKQCDRDLQIPDSQETQKLNTKSTQNSNISHSEMPADQLKLSDHENAHIRESFGSPHKTEEYSSTKFQILIKNHKRIISLHEMVLGVSENSGGASEYVCFLLLKNIQKELQTLLLRVKQSKYILRQDFDKVNSIIKSELTSIARNIDGFRENIIFVESQSWLPIAFLNCQQHNLTEKFLSQALQTHKKLILEKYISSLDSNSEIILGSQVLDYLCQSIVLKEDSYARMSKQYLLKLMKAKISRLNN